MLQNTKSKSLYYILGLSFFTIISIILIVQSTVNYINTKEELQKGVINDINVSSLQLDKSITKFIESYQITEYENLIKNEMYHNSLLAIEIEDYLTGKVMGGKSYKTGFYRDNKLDKIILLEFEDNNYSLENNADYFHKKETLLKNSDNEIVGKMVIYANNYNIEKELKQIIISNIFISFIIYTFISLILYYLIKQVLIDPINKIIISLSYKKDNEIIFNKIDEHSSKEFSFLSNSINNMTKQIQMFNKELKESEFKWQFAVEGNGDGLWDWNVKTSEVFFSKKWKEMLGFKDDEISGSLEEWEKRIHPDDLEQVYKDIQSHIEGKTDIYINEHRVKCKDGEYKWILDRGVIVEKNEKGEALRIIGTHTDITQRKLYEKQMKQALAVFENTHEGIMITNSNNEILNVNSAFIRTTGYTLEEVLNKKPSVLKSSLYPNEFYEQMWEDLQTKGFWQGEITNKNKNGKLYDEYLSINTIKNKNGEIDNFIGIFSDISILKQQEKMLMQQARTSAIGEMIGNIAHQWRQPLSVISTASTGMKLQLEMGINPSTEENLNTLEKINKQAQYLSTTIEDFRGFFTENMSDVTEFDVSETIEKVDELVKDAFKNNFIDVKYDIENELYLEANKNLLMQALINIYNNALDALKIKSIEEKKLLFVSLNKKDSKIVIRIKDNAGGIPSEFIEKVFDPYFTTKHQSQGTGIGLYMTHQIINKQLHGTISVANSTYKYEDKEYIGAEFIITL